MKLPTRRSGTGRVRSITVIVVMTFLLFLLFSSVWTTLQDAQGAGSGTAIAEDVGEFCSARMAMDDDGDALIVWYQQGDTGKYDLYTRTYSDGSLGKVTSIEGLEGDSFSPCVAMNDDGMAIVVWSQRDEMLVFSVYAVICDEGVWGEPVLLSADSEDARQPWVAMNDEGMAMVVWEDHDEKGSGSYAIAYTGGSWGTATELHYLENATLMESRVVMNEDGDVAAAWYYLTTGGNYHFDIYASFYANGSWSEAAHLEGQDVDANSPRPAIDGDGNAIVVWYQGDNSGHYDIGFSSYLNSSWGEPATLDGLDGGSSVPEIDMNEDGKAVVVWVQTYDDCSVVNARTFTNGSWGATTAIEGMMGYAVRPNVSIDDDGDAFVGWYMEMEGSDSQSIYTIKLSGGKWGNVTELDSGDMDISSIDVMLSDDGDTLVLWTQSDSSNGNSIYIDPDGASRSISFYYWAIVASFVIIVISISLMFTVWRRMRR